MLRMWCDALDQLPRTSKPHRLRLLTPPSQGRVSYVRLPILALVYTSLSSDRGHSEAHDPMPPLSVLEQERIAIELRAASPLIS